MLTHYATVEFDDGTGGTSTVVKGGFESGKVECGGKNGLAQDIAAEDDAPKAVAADGSDIGSRLA